MTETVEGNEVKHLVHRTAIFLVMLAITGGAALAETFTKEVTFIRPVTVNGTLLKAGTYKAVFDDQTGELTISRGKKVVAQTPARIEKVSKGTKSTYSTRDGSGLLLSVTLKDGNRAVIEAGGENDAARSQ
jgi:hypothetical protein